MNKILLGVIAVVVLMGLWVMGSYNGIVSLDQSAKTKWADVEGQYQRRLDLIPNLVATVKGAGKFEQETLAQVVQARASATQVVIDPNKLDSASLQKFQSAQGEVSSALGRLLAVSEAYPILKATDTYRDLMSQLEGTENRIAVARKDFNDAVKSYNTRVVQFPGNILAGMFGFEQKGFFTADKGAEKSPTVSF
ncbi:MAG: LemA family protein [Minisyncoccia bacterium]